MHLVTRIVRVATMLAIAASPAAAARRKPAPALDEPAADSARWAASFPVERHVLPNGLVVLMHEDHSVPTVTFWQWFRVGSRNERPGITGISHFFEHMMFNGSKNVPPKEYDRIIEANGGDTDAFTDLDMTAYYEDIASDRLEVLLRLDSDRMASLSLQPEMLKSEIEVVKEERRLRTDNSIPGMLNEQLYAAAFLASPYHWPVVGWMEDLNRIARDDCVAYFRTYYAPNNCILVLTGDFEPRATLAQIAKAFGPIPAQPPAPTPIVAEPEQRGERRVEVHYPAENASFQVGYKVPGATSEDVPVLRALGAILAQGESSRLYRALVYEKQIALDVGSFFEVRLDPTLFELTVEMKPGKTAAKGESLLTQTIDRLIEEGPTERELLKAKNLLEVDFVRSLKTNNGAGAQLASYEHLFGDYRVMFGALDKLQAITVADCRRVARMYFDPLHRTVAVLVPESQKPKASAP
jgi:predicted Zn-dependent peptidase